MAPAQLHPDFELSVAPASDIDEVFTVMEVAETTDEVWRSMVKNCPPEVVHKWAMDNLAARWTLPDIVTYKISEKATG